ETFLRVERSRDSEAVQRLLARGLAAGLPRTRELAVQFLLEDDRRFELGPFSDEYRDSLALLRALGPHLSGGELQTIEQAVLRWNLVPAQGDEDLGWQFEARRINRRHRLRLLTALPFERLTESTRNLIGQERVR